MKFFWQTEYSRYLIQFYETCTYMEQLVSSFVQSVRLLFYPFFGVKACPAKWLKDKSISWRENSLFKTKS